MRACQLLKVLPEISAAQGFVLLSRSSACQALGAALLHCQAKTEATCGSPEFKQKAGL
jgi:hypothetical protein